MKIHLRIATGYQYEYIEFELDDCDVGGIKKLIEDYHNIALAPSKDVKERITKSHKDKLSEQYPGPLIDGRGLEAI